LGLKKILLKTAIKYWGDYSSTWHNAINDYPGQARLMHRITLAGGALEAASKQ